MSRRFAGVLLVITRHQTWQCFAFYLAPCYLATVNRYVTIHKRESYVSSKSRDPRSNQPRFATVLITFEGQMVYTLQQCALRRLKIELAFDNLINRDNKTALKRDICRSMHDQCSLFSLKFIRASSRKLCSISWMDKIHHDTKKNENWVAFILRYGTAESTAEEREVRSLRMGRLKEERRNWGHLRAKIFV